MAIGTTAALIGASVAGGVAQASSASKAADAQAGAARDSAAAQQWAFRQTQRNLAPFRQTGGRANNALAYELGLTAKAPNGYQGFQATPGYQYALEQGNNNINALAGAQGGLNSGATLKALQENGIGLANQDYSNYLNRLSSMQGVGQASAAGVGAAAQNTAAGLSNAYSNIGNAQAAGAVGVGNALAGTINNGLGIWSYQKNMAGNGGLFSGNSWG